MDLNLESVKDFLESNKGNEDVKELLSGLNRVELAEVKKYLDSTDDGRKFLQSEKDRHFTSGLDTWKEKSLPELIKAERDKLKAELNPAETPDQKRLKELEDTIADQKLKEAEREQELLKERLTNKAKDILSEKKLPTSLVDFFVGKDEGITTENIEAFSKVFDEAVVAEVNTRLKADGRKIVDSINDKKIDIGKLSPENRLARLRQQNIVYKN